MCAVRQIHLIEMNKSTYLGYSVGEQIPTSVKFISANLQISSVALFSVIFMK